MGEGNGDPLQYSCLENPMDRGACWAAVPGVTKSRTQLSDFTFTFHFHALEEEMATHSSVLAWRIPGMAEPSGLLSMGSHRVGHNWSDLAAYTVLSHIFLYVEVAYPFIHLHILYGFAHDRGTFYTYMCLPTFAAAAAKSLQSYLTLCNPIDGSPPGSCPDFL